MFVIREIIYAYSVLWRFRWNLYLLGYPNGLIQFHSKRAPLWCLILPGTIKHVLLVKFRKFLSDFIQIGFSGQTIIRSQYQILRKSVQCEPWKYVQKHGRTDRQTDRQTERRTDGRTDIHDEGNSTNLLMHTVESYDYSSTDTLIISKSPWFKTLSLKIHLT